MKEPALCTKGSKMVNFLDFRAVFGYVREFCKFEKYIDSRIPHYNDKSTILAWSQVQAKDSDVALRVARLIFLIIFVTSCYVLNKIVILSENSIPERFGSISGHEI